jgi:hypothetical protein
MGWDLRLWTAVTTGYNVHPPDDLSLKSHGGMILTGENRNLGEKSVPLPLCPPQIARGLTRGRTRTSVVTDRRLTAWATARPTQYSTVHKRNCRLTFRCMIIHYLIKKVYSITELHSWVTTIFVYKYYLQHITRITPINLKSFTNTAIGRVLFKAILQFVDL